MLVLIDNYDSFTWNVYQSLRKLGAEVRVFRNDAVTVEEVAALNPSHLVISPGPGHPTTDSGISKACISYFAGKIPILGVCMGQQCMVEVYGGKVGHAGEIVHGKSSEILHDGKGVYTGLPTHGVENTRYHSLAALPTSLPSSGPLYPTSRTSSGIIMGVRHRDYCIEGVQFHPESILSGAHGHQMLANFLSLSSGSWEEEKIKKSTTSLAHHTPPKTPDSALSTIKSPSPSSSSPKASSILQTIAEQRRKDIARAKSIPGQRYADLERRLGRGEAPPVQSLHTRLTQAIQEGSGDMSLIAEVKRASPSRGSIDDSLDAGEVAREYAMAGAAAISVLTEPTWFHGSLDDLRAVRASTQWLGPRRPAILRKEFILDPYQILEARLAGADSILLILAILDDPTFHQCLYLARSLGMEPLVEVATSQEMTRAVAAGSKVIGVNNRDLHTFTVDPKRTANLASGITLSPDTLLVALSGITGREAVQNYQSVGAKAILVGEALVRAADKPAFVRHLLGQEEQGSGRTDELSITPAPGLTIKICGVRTVEAALAAARAGADLIGLILVPSSRRFVGGIPEAQAIVRAVRHFYSDSSQQTTAPTTTPSNSIRGWHDLQARRLREDRQSAGLGPAMVGVFQDMDPNLMAQWATAIDLDYIQLHGSEPLGIERTLPRPVIRTFHVDADGKEERLASDLQTEGHWSLALLDAQVGKAAGGQGKAFDWRIASRLSERVPTIPFILAGGLTVSGVEEAIRQVRPWGVDVSSGVEGSDGQQDPVQITSFIEAARRASLSS
ncbi:MAG: indole-3-glycerol phosphate synthase-domain-containing protein [Piptocephalis tieghemiana]|nr:MAG: indole-3-glycerol phosphate synthase-domain-containing protein [Piptocephalis tieghemiana]